MISLTFRDFYDCRYEDGEYDLYVLRDKDAVLYVGISRENVHDRWFGGGFSHMNTVAWSDYPVSSTDLIGERVYINYPESLEWTMELWSVNDCVEYIGENTGVPKGVLSKNLSVIESEMIRILTPLYNRTMNRKRNLEPRTRAEKERHDLREKKLDSIYDSIFNT